MKFVVVLFAVALLVATTSVTAADDPVNINCLLNAIKDLKLDSKTVPKVLSIVSDIEKATSDDQSLLVTLLNNLKKAGVPLEQILKCVSDEVANLLDQ